MLREMSNEIFGRQSAELKDGFEASLYISQTLEAHAPPRKKKGKRTGGETKMDLIHSFHRSAQISIRFVLCNEATLALLRCCLLVLVTG